MKNSFNVFLLFLLFVAASCTKELPNPALPDVASIPTDPIKTFGLVSPSSGLSLNIKKGTQEVALSWTASEGAALYDWVADRLTGNFSTPLLVIPANNAGKNTNLTLTYTQLYDALTAAGVADGAKIDLKWSVRAKSGSAVKLAATPRNISFQKGGVTFTVYAPSNTPTDYDVYLAGEFGFLPGASNWQQPGTNSSLKMNKNSDGSYSLILGIPNAQAFDYKYFIAPKGSASWNNGERAPNSNGIGTQGAANRKFTYNGTNDAVSQVVSFWEGFDFSYVVFNLTAPANTPADRNVFVAGEFSNLGAPENWQQPGTNPKLQMTQGSGQNYFIVFPQPASGTSLGYKYFVSSVFAPTWGNGSDGGNKSFTFGGTNNGQSDTVTAWDGI